MSDELLSRAEGPAHRLTLNRPRRRNALTPELARALADEIDRVSGLAETRVIVLTGAAGHFCPGLDLHWLLSLGANPPIADLQRGLRDFQSAVLAIVRSPLPVVALLPGSSAGFGLDLALACDMRVAGAGAMFSSAFARIGLVPDGGSTLTLRLLIGPSQALRFLLAGETLDAAQALRLGLVDDVVDDVELDAAGRRLAEGIAAGAESSARAIKRLSRAPELGALEQALAAEGAAQLQALQGPEFQRRLAAFVAARTPSPAPASEPA